MKVCKTCKKQLSLSSFYKQRRNKDGHRNECRVCTTARTRQYQTAIKVKNRELANVGAMVYPEQKKCSVCKITKHYSEFSKYCAKSDGLCSNYKSCRQYVSNMERKKQLKNGLTNMPTTEKLQVVNYHHQQWLVVDNVLIEYLGYIDACDLLYRVKDDDKRVLPNVVNLSVTMLNGAYDIATNARVNVAVINEFIQWLDKMNNQPKLDNLIQEPTQFVMPISTDDKIGNANVTIATTISEFIVRAYNDCKTISFNQGATSDTVTAMANQLMFRLYDIDMVGLTTVTPVTASATVPVPATKPEAKRGVIIIPTLIDDNHVNKRGLFSKFFNKSK